MRWFFLLSQIALAQNNCASLGGDYWGVLLHGATRQHQWFQLTLKAEETSSVAPSCIFSGQLELIFGDPDSTDRQKAVIAPTTLALPTKKSDFFISLDSEEKDGFVVELVLNNSKLSTGNLYSKTLGILGAFRLAKGIPQKSRLSFVPARAGTFALQTREAIQLKLDPKPEANHIGAQGQLLGGNDVAIDNVLSISHDLSTNFISLRTEKGLLAGYLNANGLELLDRMTDEDTVCPRCTQVQLFTWQRLR